MVLLSASTLGAPGVSLDQVLLWLQAAAFEGIELRFSAGEIAHPAMTRSDRLSLRHRIEDAGIRVTGIASYVSVCSPAEDDLSWVPS